MGYVVICKVNLQVDGEGSCSLLVADGALPSVLLLTGSNLNSPLLPAAPVAGVSGYVTCQLRQPFTSLRNAGAVPNIKNCLRTHTAAVKHCSLNAP